MMFLDYGAVTHTGQRVSNEDSFCLPAQDTGETLNMRLFAVADGMGGHRGGSLASQLACRDLVHYDHHPSFEKYSWNLRDFSRYLGDGVIKIDRRIREEGVRHPEFAEMGTTLSCLVLTRLHSIITHVGDSRIYRLRRGYLSILTTDHTFVQDMIFEGEVDPAKAANHPLRHLLTRVLGTPEPLEWVDTRIDPVHAGDIFLLCTDGLHNSLGPGQIKRVLKKPWRARRTAAALVSKALLAGAKDNVTVLIIKVKNLKF